jgi:hypothetical protein
MPADRRVTGTARFLPWRCLEDRERYSLTLGELVPLASSRFDIVSGCCYNVATL